LKAYREGLARGVADLLPESRIVVKQLAQSLDVPIVRLFEIGLENEGEGLGFGTTGHVSCLAQTISAYLLTAGRGSEYHFQTGVATFIRPQMQSSTSRRIRA
jgi:hypothetical protein